MLIVHFFVSYAHVNLCHIFSSSWCRGLAVASACGSSWTLLFTFLKNQYVFFFVYKRTKIASVYLNMAYEVIGLNTLSVVMLS